MTDQQIAKTATRAALATRLLIVVGLILGSVIVGLQLYTTLQIREEQKVGATRGKSIERTADAIESCTTPGQPCYQRSQRTTADAIGSINEVAVYAAACADKPRRQTVVQIQQCVLDALENRKKDR